MSNIPKIEEITLADDFVLTATFDNGIIKQLDFKPFLESQRFAELRDIAIWKNGRITPGRSAVAWTDNIDICENKLWLKSVEV